jgi:signal transduction histidine kinase/CheY-like chemotaxis protein
VVEFLGRTGDYLRLPPGKPSFHLIAMARPGLGRVLRRAILEAGESRKPVQASGRCLGPDGGLREVAIAIQRVSGGPKRGLLQILFSDVTPQGHGEAHSKQRERQETGAGAPRGPRPSPDSAGADQRGATFLESAMEEREELIRTLKAANAKQKASKRTLEIARDELQSINMELEAASAEFEAANRDLEASTATLERALSERDRALEERRRLEATMLQTQKLESLGVLAGGIAHDFNNLLVSVVGNASLLLEDLDPASPLRPLADDILQAGHRAAELVDRILAYSGKGKSGDESIDLSAIAVEMAHLLKAAIPKKITVDLQLMEGLPVARGDGTQIRQVVMNLITNAAEAIGEELGLIRITTGLMEIQPGTSSEHYLGSEPTPGRYAFCEVADNGCGMDEKTKARIFDPFFTTKFKGRGLGLAAVLGIVRTHRGAINVDSRPTYGSTFRVLLPTSYKSVPEARDDSSVSGDSAMGQTRVVLVVDDEPSVLRLAEMTLQRAGLVPLTAADGVRAIELFRERDGEIAAVVLDLTLPEMDGHEVLREVHKIRPEMPVILSSGYNEEATNEKFHAGKAVTFLQKPYRPGQLLKKVREVLGGATVGIFLSSGAF